MRSWTLPQAAKQIAVCLLGVFGTLIFQGCKDDAPQPYAELDARFPEGRPGLADTDARAQDAAYQAALTAAAKELSGLQQTASAARAEAERFGKTLTEQLSARVGKTPPAKLVAAELETNEHYQKLLKTAEAAEAAVRAKQQENQKLIRDRMWADANAYDRMKAQADEQARQAGVAVRNSAEAARQQAQTAKAQARQAAAEAKARAKQAAEEAKAAAAKARASAPTLDDLSKASGIPVLPAKQ